MSSFMNMVQLQLLLFLLIAVGVFARKRSMLTDGAQKGLTDLFINIILPANIVASFHVTPTRELISNAAQILLIAFGVQFFQWGLSKVLYRRVPHGKQMVVRYATICSNSGFMGNPVVQGIYGAEGLMYASLFLIPVRIFMWSAGLSLFTVTSRRDLVKKLLLHPCIIAVYLGIALMLVGYRIPPFLNEGIASLSACTTALAMILIGSILADVSLRALVDRLMLYYSAVRLLLIPLAVLLVLRLFHVSPLLTGIAVLLAGMPAGSTTAILAMQYGCDASYASRCVLFTTLLSLVTLPALTWLVQAVA